MGVYRKKALLDMAAAMAKANDSVLSAATPQRLTDMLIQCQNAALEMGTSLESMGERYTVMVHLLEDYCESLYQMSISLADEHKCRMLSADIRRRLTALQDSIRYTMPEDRREVVFLPYKASMWDSLESVWKAADADENTDAYVIPIPYYDRNPDGSFRKEHYEGDLYPEYVPVTNYKEYDFKSRRPNEIYIHNAYDSSNFVTSVHPFFYSENLKQYTESLVYIPYFILGEVDPDNEEAVKQIAHFCLAPGVFHADRVIVQSEAMKKVYVNVLTDFMKKKSGENTRAYWENKILGLGSPKMSKVAATRREDVHVPDEWLRIIQKPAGERKKIILYNTGVVPLLTYGNRAIEKIKRVFQIFRSHSESVALLWRPHPLVQATIESMRPQLWEAYREVLEQYREAGWGIYDDTADLDRAIVLSDAYYGDPSSLVTLCRGVGMPVMIQNMDM